MSEDESDGRLFRWGNFVAPIADMLLVVFKCKLFKPMVEPQTTDPFTPSSGPQGQNLPGGLSRQLGLGSAVAAVAGESIAVGIFLTPAGMARSLGSPFWLLMVWLVMGAMALSGAFCYGELAARFPAAGGGYVYLREAYGPRLAFLYGWMSFLVLDPGVTAALGVGLASYAGYIVGLSRPRRLTSFSRHSTNVTGHNTPC